MSGVQGTFLVRPSLSLAGAMVLSVVVEGVIKHMALDGNQLDTRSLEVHSSSPPIPCSRTSQEARSIVHQQVCSSLAIFQNGPCQAHSSTCAC